MRRTNWTAVAGAIAVGSALALGTAAAQQQDFSKVEIDAVKVTDNIYMLVGAGGNTTIQFGPEGVMVVDTSFAPMSEKILAEIKKLSNQPIRYVVDTHVHGDHIGGNSAIAKAGRTRAGGNVVGDLGSAATIIPLPASAINYAPYGDSVYVVQDLKNQKGQAYKGVRQQFVKLGPGRGDQIAVLDGLKPGEEVVTSGVFKLRQGAAVQVNNKTVPSNNPAPKPEDS